MLEGKRYRGPLADMWSLGVILYALLCGFLPFEHPNTNKLYAKIKAGRYEVPSFVSAGARDLISRLLTTDPARRYTPAHVRAHPWYRGLAVPTDPPVPGAQPLPPAAAAALGGDPWAAVDGGLVADMIAGGYRRADIVDALATRTRNHVTATYFLLRARKLKAAAAQFPMPVSGGVVVSLPAPVAVQSQPPAPASVQASVPATAAHAPPTHTSATLYASAAAAAFASASAPIPTDVAGPRPQSATATRQQQLQQLQLHQQRAAAAVPSAVPALAVQPRAATALPQGVGAPLTHGHSSIGGTAAHSTVGGSGSPMAADSAFSVAFRVGSLQTQQPQQHQQQRTSHLHPSPVHSQVLTVRATEPAGGSDLVLTHASPFLGVGARASAGVNTGLGPGLSTGSDASASFATTTAIGASSSGGVIAAASTPSRTRTSDGAAPFGSGTEPCGTEPERDGDGDGEGDDSLGESMNAAASAALHHHAASGPLASVRQLAVPASWVASQAFAPGSKQAEFVAPFVHGQPLRIDSTAIRPASSRTRDIVVAQTAVV